MVQVLLATLEAGLSLWEHKERNKYRDKLISLKKDWYEEFNKDPARRSDARLDAIEFELRILATSFTSIVGAQDPAPQS